MQDTIPVVCYVFMYLKIAVKLHSHLPDVGTWTYKVSELIFLVNQNQCHILNTSMYILWWKLRLFCMFSYLITGKAIIPTSVTNMTLMICYRDVLDVWECRCVDADENMSKNFWIWMQMPDDHILSDVDADFFI